MLWWVCFLAAALCMIAGAAGFFVRRRYGKSEVRYLGTGVFLACVFACFPGMCLSEKPPFALAMSISHSIRMFVVDTGVSDILELLTGETPASLFYPYKILVCLLYLLAPVFTLSVVLRYFSNFFERLRLTVRKHRDLCVFSELNPRALEIAVDIRTASEGRGEKTGIIFCRSSEKDKMNMELEERARELGAVFVAGGIEFLRLGNRKRYISYFLISDDEEKNTDHTLQMIDHMTGDSPWVRSGKLEQKNTAVYCYASTAEAEILLDAKDKEELRVVLMDEVRDAVYEHLCKYPLYSRVQRKSGRLSVLIVGGGKAGIEFLKASLWCGQMKEYTLDIHMIDLKGNLIRKRLGEECPELFDDKAGYQLEIRKANVFSDKTGTYLDTLADVSYCAVCLGDDEDSMRAAMWLKKYFYMRGKPVQPLICVYIASGKKRETLWNLYENTREKGKAYYGIIPFGSRGTHFGDRSDAAFILEYLGLGVQAHYWRLNEKSGEQERRAAVKNFYEKQCNRRSSIASGLHIGSKLWELGLGLLRVPREAKEKEVFEQYIHPVDFRDVTVGRLQPYYNVEHERWMAYMRTEGWRLAAKGGSSLQDIRQCYEEYCDQFKNQNYMMRLHPALVPVSRTLNGGAVLQEVEDMITAVNKERGLGDYNPDYVRSDVEVVNHIGDIVGGAWCGCEGISIRGTLAQPGECVVCRLDDIYAYCAYLYEQQKDMATAEKRILLRERLYQCRQEERELAFGE